MDRLKEQVRKRLRRHGFSQNEIAMELRELDWQRRNRVSILPDKAFIMPKVLDMPYEERRAA